MNSMNRPVVMRVPWTVPELPIRKSRPATPELGFVFEVFETTRWLAHPRRPPPFLAVEWIPIVQWKAAVDHRNPFVNTTIAPYRRETADGSLDGSEEQWRAPSSFESNRLSPHNRLVCGRTLWNRNAPTLPALAQVPQGPCQFGNERTAAFHWNWVPSPRQTKIRLVKSKRSTRLDILALFYFPNKAWRINLRNCNLFFRIVYKSCPFSVDVELGYWMRMVSAGCCFHNQVRPLLLRTNQVQN